MVHALTLETGKFDKLYIKVNCTSSPESIQDENCIENDKF